MAPWPTFLGGPESSLKSKQREVFEVVHKWVKEYVKCNGHNVEPIHIFLSGNGGTANLIW